MANYIQAGITSTIAKVVKNIRAAQDGTTSPQTGGGGSARPASGQMQPRGNV